MKPISLSVDYPDVPPALSLLLTEIFQSKSPIIARKRIKAILPTLRDQSEVFVSDHLERPGYDRDPTKFDIHLHGGLDLLTHKGGCIEIECRLQAADRIARSIGLIADRIWITDTFSDRFMDFGRVTNEKLDEIIADVYVLVRLLPFITAGILRFTSPVVPLCSHCISEFDDQVENITKNLIPVFQKDFRLKRRKNGGYSVYTGNCFEPPVVMQSERTDNDKIPTTKYFSEHSIKHEVDSILWTAREAALSGGSILSNSRLGLSGLLFQEGRLIDRQTLLFLDKEREFSVPWVSELDAGQIVQLRDEASKALPAFRQKLAKAMAFSDETFLQPGLIIEGLREQAQEVRSELEIKQSTSARYWKTTYALLGLGLSAYGVSSGQIPPSIAGLLPLIQLLIGHKTGHEADIAKLTTRPGYVLVKARDLLAHSRKASSQKTS